MQGGRCPPRLALKAELPFLKSAVPNRTCWAPDAGAGQADINLATAPFIFCRLIYSGTAIASPHTSPVSTSGKKPAYVAVIV